MLRRVNNASELGQAIRQARRVKGLTLEDVALAAGTGVRFVSELERGKPTVEIERTLRVLSVIGMRAYVEG